jgi:hypothetical protein
METSERDDGARSQRFALKEKTVVRDWKVSGHVKVCTHCGLPIRETSDELICESVICNAMYHKKCIFDALRRTRTICFPGKTSSDLFEQS